MTDRREEFGFVEADLTMRRTEDGGRRTLIWAFGKGTVTRDVPAGMLVGAR